MTNHENRQFLARREGEITDQEDRLPKAEMPSKMAIIPPIEGLYLLDQEELFELVLAEVRDKFDVCVGEDDMYIACFPKEISAPYPILGAHLDVKNNVPPYFVQEWVEDGCRVHVGFDQVGERCILGADDRNGVWAMLELINQGFTDWGYIFTKFEEVGRLGAIAVRESGILQERRDEIAYFLMLDEPYTDRLGYRVMKKLPGKPTLHDNAMFIRKLAIFGCFEGYKLAKDGSTDYIEYCLATGLCGINLSVGYMNYHKPEEYSDMVYVKKLPRIIEKLVKHLGAEQYALQNSLSISA